MPFYLGTYTSWSYQTVNVNHGEDLLSLLSSWGANCLKQLPMWTIYDLSSVTRQESFCHSHYWGSCLHSETRFYFSLCSLFYVTINRVELLWIMKQLTLISVNNLICIFGCQMHLKLVGGFRHLPYDVKDVLLLKHFLSYMRTCLLVLLWSWHHSQFLLQLCPLKKTHSLTRPFVPNNSLLIWKKQSLKEDWVRVT